MLPVESMLVTKKSIAFACLKLAVIELLYKNSILLLY
jgi:hypothetical protein